MKPIKFLGLFQLDFFPDRSTVGREVVAELLGAPKVVLPSTEAGGQLVATAPRARQARLPIEPAKRSWWRRS